VCWKHEYVAFGDSASEVINTALHPSVLQLNLFAIVILFREDIYILVRLREI
jgi:hypothetical protein